MGARHRDCDGGWVLEKEAGCKGRHCGVCDKSCPSGDEGGGSCMAQRCRSVPGFGSGKAGDERGGFLTPTASHFDA